MPSVTVYRQRVEIDTANYVISDSPAARHVTVRFVGMSATLTLWAGDDYTSVGDYTQAQVDARIAELLGSDPAATLQGLVDRPPFVSQ